ncbi:MAG TPA: ribose-5-phosphate isomerase RpiA [Bryobacteraceae bacterium]|nr:ribose-5-phosphate isomerase RpiA [Bryobacteraceae bacterium]
MLSTTESKHQSDIDRLKRSAARAAASQLQNGMIVGLGSGTTATLAVAEIGERVREGLQIIGIPTSEKTAGQARSLGIPLSTLGEHAQIDVAIDGADEVELDTLNLIKGGGGNQLREKIVASASTRFVVIVDETKVVRQLGTHAKVPVEVAQFGWQATARKLAKLGGNPALRLRADNERFITDGGNYILDCAFGPIASPAALERELNDIVGVVEHGLFIGMACQALVGTPEGVKTLDRK